MRGWPDRQTKLAVIVLGMRQFPESAFEYRDEGRGFLSLVGMTLVLLTAGIALALLIAAA